MPCVVRQIEVAIVYEGQATEGCGFVTGFFFTLLKPAFGYYEPAMRFEEGSGVFHQYRQASHSTSHHVAESVSLCCAKCLSSFGSCAELVFESKAVDEVIDCSDFLFD